MIPASLPWLRIAFHLPPLLGKADTSQAGVDNGYPWGAAFAPCQGISVRVPRQLSGGVPRQRGGSSAKKSSTSQEGPGWLMMVWVTVSCHRPA